MILGAAFIKNPTAVRAASVDSSGIFGGLFNMGAPGRISVNQSTALTVGAFYNAVDQISNDIAKTPFKVFRNVGNKVERVSEHPVDMLLHKEPSPLMTSFTFRKMLIQSAIIKGDGFAVIVTNNSGVPVELVYTPFDEVTDVKKYQNQLYYTVKGYTLPIPASSMIHIMGFSDEGLRGISVVKYMAASLGISINAQDFARKSYDNKAISSGVLSTESQIKLENKKVISTKFNEHMNAGHKHNTAVLDDGLKYQRISLTPDELKILDTMKNGVIEISRFLNIAPHKIKDMSNANYSSLEYLGIEHQQDCVMPWQLKLEQECDRKLFTPAEKAEQYFTRFNNNILLRTDIKSRADWYSKGIFSGWLAPNEVRRLENLPAIEGLEKPYQPVNAQTQEQVDAKIESLNG